MSRPSEWRETGEQDLFRARLDHIIDMNHELVRLAHQNARRSKAPQDACLTLNTHVNELLRCAACFSILKQTAYRRSPAFCPKANGRFPESNLEPRTR